MERKGSLSHTHPKTHTQDASRLLVQSSFCFHRAALRPRRLIDRRRVLLGFPKSFTEFYRIARYWVFAFPSTARRNESHDSDVRSFTEFVRVLVGVGNDCSRRRIMAALQDRR